MTDSMEVLVFEEKGFLVMVAFRRQRLPDSLEQLDF